MALSRWRDVWRRFTGRGAYPHELAFLEGILGGASVLARFDATEGVCQVLGPDDA